MVFILHRYFSQKNQDEFHLLSNVFSVQQLYFTIFQMPYKFY